MSRARTDLSAGPTTAPLGPAVWHNGGTAPLLSETGDLHSLAAGGPILSSWSEKIRYVGVLNRWFGLLPLHFLACFLLN